MSGILTSNRRARGPVTQHSSVLDCLDHGSLRRYRGMFTEQVLRNTTDAQSPTHRVRTPAVIYVAPDLGFEVLYA